MRTVTFPLLAVLGLCGVNTARAAELAIINSVQAALAAKLDMQAIYDAVGDKIPSSIACG